MSKFQFENNNEEKPATADQSSMQSLNEATRDILSIIVRMCGLILVFIGLWIAIQVFNEALALYKDPANIERMAVAIETGSNIDKSIAPLKESLLGEAEQEQAAYVQPRPSSPANGNGGIRVSYFIAWVVELLLLLLIARIALMAIKTGGELALYDAQVRKLARQIIQANKKDT